MCDYRSSLLLASAEFSIQRRSRRPKILQKCPTASPDLRAGSCFGDSGGPALQANGDSQNVVGVTHAGGTMGSNIVSEYSDLTR
ncbi:trypsin-like serine protease, partial [Chamaesiphon sp. OTE_75_metabat_556]|uniref:trypsin-like serine protease n=1 Tax=Chamaesiphon sp. OTE_75_metabat_556 TaxID=2964692 RepID=UPI0037BE7A74